MMSKKKKLHIPVEKNATYESSIVDFTHEGMGVAKIDGYPIFVEGAIKDEIVEFKVVKTGKKFSFGKLLKVIDPSPDRVEIKDKVYSQTGTMSLQHMSYDAQLRFKKGQVENALSKIGKFRDVPIFDTIGMENPYGYRNKAQVPVREKEGHLMTGFFRKHSHDVIPLEDFVIQDPVIDQTIVQVRNILEKFGLRGFDEENHRGDIRHIMVRRGYFTGDIMIVIVSRTKNLRYKEEIKQKIVEEISGVVSVIRNINTKKTNVILGEDFEVLYGEDDYTDNIFDFTFHISHQSFFQINSVQTEKLYQTALDYADLQGNETVIDAYSGIGTLTLSLAKDAGFVYGVEVVEPAVNNAIQNAKVNGIENVEFSVGKAEDWMVEKADQGTNVDVVVVDPPRKGLTESFVNAVLEATPEKMVYVSCNPSTLARDLRKLADGGYMVEKAQPVDMFPQTFHTECVVLLTKTNQKI